MEALDLFNEKLDVLLKKYRTLQADNLRLRATIEGQNKVIQRLHKKVNTLDSNMVSVHLGKAEISEDEKENMRRQLDSVIGEIDKILGSLNE